MFEPCQCRDHGQHIVPRPLYTAQGDPAAGVVLSVVNVTIRHEGNIQTRDVAVVPEYPEVSVGGNHPGLEYFLPNNGAERMWRGL